MTTSNIYFLLTARAILFLVLFVALQIAMLSLPRTRESETEPPLSRFFDRFRLWLVAIWCLQFLSCCVTITLRPAFKLYSVGVYHSMFVFISNALAILVVIYIAIKVLQYRHTFFDVAF